MFSMFFGAGNIVFPLLVGLTAREFNSYATIGLMISAILVPFLGLISMTVFDGDYRRFFSRIGVVPGMLLAALILALIGPFGAIPRCISLSFATAQLFVPSLSLWGFSLVSCIIVFLFTYRRSKLLDLLGFVLTPLLLLSLVLIVVLGFVHAPQEVAEGTLTPQEAFFEGLINGYQTMDLLGAFFFSSVVLVCLQRELDPEGNRPYHQLVVLALKASLIGAGLLGLFYAGFSFVAAYNADTLADLPPQAVLGSLALQTLGPYAGIVACTAVALACLTTAIALSAVFAQFLYQDVFRETINYPTGLVITLVVSFVVSTFEFTGIAAALAPILRVFYPGLIVLSIVNLMHQLTGFSYVKTPVYLTFAAMLGLHLWPVIQSVIAPT
jgi:LIVCS family branched-chain amino acid:cation transporter